MTASTTAQAASSARTHALNVLADLPLQPMTPLLQLLDGAVLWKLVGRASHLALRQRAREQLLGHGKQVLLEGKPWWEDALEGWALTSAISLYLPSMDVRRSTDCFKATGMPGKECWEVRRWRAPRRSARDKKGERKRQIYAYCS